MDAKTARIRALNDELRQHLTGGMAVITPGVAALGAEAVERIVKTIAVFDDFCHANDPHEEHDFGSTATPSVQDRLLRSRSVNAFARPSRSNRHPTRHHDHAGGGILAAMWLSL
jgi:Protein of unknown function (DUF3768)